MARCGAVGLMVAAMAVSPAVGQSPIVLSSQVETGWTSNATDSAAGEADIYASHRHEVVLTGETENFLLRGSLAISQTRFKVTQFEDDDEVTGSVETQFALGEGVVLRLGYGQTRGWSGDDVSISGVLIPLRSADVAHEYLGELVVLGADQKATATVIGAWTVPGETELVGLGLPPLRLAPEVGSVTGRIEWERALGPSLAVLAGMEAWFTLVPEADQLTYFRPPADGSRVSSGLRLQEAAFSLEGHAGVDLVWPKGLASELTRTMPFLAVAASVVPLASVTLVLEAQTGVELADPLDSVAGRTLAVDLGASWALTPELELSAGLGGWQERGIYDESLVRSRRSATLGLRYAVNERLDYGITLSVARHDNPDESYDKAGVAFSLGGSL